MVENCEVCERRGRENTETAEHRLIHIEMPQSGQRRRLYLNFVDGAGISVSSEIPDLAKTVGEWFLNELGFLTSDLKKTCPFCGACGSDCEVMQDHVLCRVCGATGPYSSYSDGEPEDYEPPTGLELWNNRAV